MEVGFKLIFKDMKVKDQINQSFLKSIEFKKLLENLASHCQTPAGREFLKTFGPLADKDLIENRLLKTQELEKQMAKQKAPAIPDSQYFVESFEKARAKGDIFSGIELASIIRFLSEVVALRQYLSPDQPIPAVFQ